MIYLGRIYLEKTIGEIFSKTDEFAYFAFVDLEKTFDGVPRNVVWWALGKLDVEDS